MHTLKIILSITSLALAVPASAQSEAAPKGTAHTTLLRDGQLPELDAYSAEGKPLKLRELCQGKYTVLSSGCLTCPQFHETYTEIEAANADFSELGVQFFYFYKSLRHPELNGYIDAQNISERLLQLAEARKLLGTKVPWIADTIEDSMRIALGANSQSVYLISPEGEILYASGNIKRDELRAALTKAVGNPPTETKISDLNLPTIERPAPLVNKATKLTVERPEGLTILAVTPSKPDETYLVKLRAEADDNLLKTGTGRLFLGFYPDPIHDAHWNNLTEPMHFKLTLPEGVTATPSKATAEKGEGDSDTKPRQFWIDITSDTPAKELTLNLDYFGCTADVCMALSHEYTILLQDENRGARTYGMNRGTRSNGQKRQNTQPTGDVSSRLQGMDTNEDGSVSYEEMKGSAKERRGEDFNEERFKTRFQSMDTNKDGTLSSEELSSAPRASERPNR
ncbi:MAG: EF-hand domain-containing protein [Akkermansiaceae bacterium]|jgi:Ca2+-binding EF-hand superfamily protein|nr:EF-hand domain-containing protein [Akkermansiaceae bacterium]MDP4645615.1 EF-hand domain-containing protein [Akkermansiaceae bacterium]MDP4722168.1 EF-hand domain-containing protein [Akkermansiaceae bacterium]MDP4780839.1 EF-hand domain-containing protein [Akkermansiaceae bacterium]MDP4848413.1 EF-hand domain-containing protein [Akkermansiaceae bacterium]